MLKRREFLATSAAAAVVAVIPLIPGSQPKPAREVFASDWAEKESNLPDEDTVKWIFSNTEKLHGVRLANYKRVVTYHPLGVEVGPSRIYCWHSLWSAEVIG